MDRRISAILPSFSLGLLALALLALAQFPQQAFAQAILMSSAGPINRSMGGAAVAAPLDAIGAIRWNPATLSGLESNELGFGADLIFPILSVDSSIDGFGAGSTSASPGVTPNPTIGWSHQLEETPYTLGLGLIGVGGFRSNYPASSTNPFLMPQSNTPGVPGGFGRIFTSAQFLDVSPALSIALSDELSIGVSPNLTLGEVVADPLFIAPPNDADGSGAARYGSGRGTQMQWGAGVQCGVYYLLTPDVRLGASIKSPTWFQKYQYQSEDELGQPLRLTYHWDLPLTVSTGFSYSGIESTLFAVDVRYIDFQSAAGLGDTGFNPDGSLRGLGWHSVFSVSAGVQRQVNDLITLRGGYTFNEDPIPSELTTVAVTAPLYYQHQVSLGGSLLLAKNVSLNAAYTYYLPRSITGPIVTPLGEVPNSSVTSSMSAHIASMGITVRY